MYNQFGSQQMPSGLYLNDVQCERLFLGLNNLNNIAFMEKEARKIAEKKLQFYENGKVDFSESIREIADKCLLTVLYKGSETALTNWYIEKCYTILFNMSEDNVMAYLCLSIKSSSIDLQLIIKESDLKGTKIIDIFENNGCSVMQVGSKQRRALQFVRYIRNKAQCGDITNIPFINGWENGKYICSFIEGIDAKEIFGQENPYTRKYFSNVETSVDKSYKIFNSLVEVFGNEDTNLALSIAIWGMLYSIFAKYGHQEEKMLAIENKKNIIAYEGLMTQWVKRRVFSASQQKKYLEVVRECKDEVAFLRMDVCNNYGIVNILGNLLPMVEKHEIADSNSGEVRKIKSLFLLETDNWRVFDKVLKLPFNMEKDVKINVTREDISALYRSICQWLEKNYELVEKWIKTNSLEKDVEKYKEVYFCLKVSNQCLHHYFYGTYSTKMLSEDNFNSYIMKWLSGNVENNDIYNSDKIINKIIEMKNAGTIRFLSRLRYDYKDKDGVIFLVDMEWVYIPAESMINIATEALGQISKISLKKLLEQDGVSNMESGHFGTEVIVGKEKRRTRMIRLKRKIILSEAELMYYMEV